MTKIEGAVVSAKNQITGTVSGGNGSGRVLSVNGKTGVVLLSAEDVGAVSAHQDTALAGTLLYIAEDGGIMPLRLGAGLEIRDGMLVLTAGGTVIAEITVDADGNAVITGASITVNDEGDAVLSSGGLVVDDDGNATFK